MTDFLTRVMLIDGDEQDYLALDRAMLNFHFGKTIQSRFGQTYALPRGTYLSQSHNMSATDVRNLALVAAHPIGRRVDIITTGGELHFSCSPLKPRPALNPPLAPTRNLRARRQTSLKRWMRRTKIES